MAQQRVSGVIRLIDFLNEEVNLSTLRPEGRGLLKVHPEPRLLTPP